MSISFILGVNLKPTFVPSFKRLLCYLVIIPTKRSKRTNFNHFKVQEFYFQFLLTEGKMTLFLHWFD